MAFTTNAYCTLAQVKNALRLDLSTTQDDGWIVGDLIPDAQAEIDQYCNRTWQTDGTAQTPATRVYSGRDNDYLLIDECMSVSSVKEVQYSTYYDINLGQWVLNQPLLVDITSDCILQPNNATPGWKLRRLSGLNFALGTQNYQVNGVFGNATIPGPITRACIRLVVHWFKMRDTNYADGLVGQNNLRQSYKKQMPDDIKELLDNYRRTFFYADTR